MDDGVNIRVVPEEFLDLDGVAEFALHERNLLAHDLLNAVHGFLARIYEIVRYYDVITRFDQLNAGVASNVSGSAADKYHS